MTTAADSPGIYKALVLGATGALGSRVATELLRRGVQVRALRRWRSGVEALGERADAIDWAVGDLRDREALRWAVSGCDVVFHVAGHSPTWGEPRRELMEHGLVGMRNVLAILREVTLSRLVYVSSALTLVPGGDGLEPRLPGVIGDDLMQLKYFMELEALKYAALGYPVVVVNPALCLGGGGARRPGGQALVKAWSEGRVRLVKGGELAVIDVEDAARGVVEAALSGRVGERNLVAGHVVTARGLAERLGRGGATVSVPEAAWWAWARRRLPREVALLCGHGFAPPRQEEAWALLGGEVRPLEETLRVCVGG